MIENADALRVVLVAPRNPLNIGAAARAMSNFGFFRMRVVNPYAVAYAEAKSAVNASAVLAASEQFAETAQAVGDCGLVVGTTAVGHRELAHTLRPLEEGCSLIREALAQGPAALLFGSEKFGLSNDDLSHCHWLMRIPTREEHGSMNLGQAVAVCLYELTREEGPRPARRVLQPAGGEERERFTGLMLDLLRESGYLQPATSASAERKLRRLVARLNLNARDAAVWQGMLRQIAWKLRRNAGVEHSQD